MVRMASLFSSGKKAHAAEVSKKTGAKPPAWDGTYDGETDSEGRRSGFGVYTFPSGDVYRGTWVANEKSGYGAAEFTSGSRYEGDWYADMKHGHGRFDFGHDGSVYIGDWVRDRKHGWGTAYFKTGNRYEGDWDADRMHGAGKFLYVTGDTFEGQWESNRKSGAGVWTSADGQTTYAGEWRHDLRHGDGMLLENGKLYLVSYTNGKLTSKTPAPPEAKAPRPLDRYTSSPEKPPPKPQKASWLEGTVFSGDLQHLCIQGRDYIAIQMPDVE